MFCPKCRSEFRDGFTRCFKCGTDLVAELPLEKPQTTPIPTPRREVTGAPRDLVKFASFLTPLDAYLTRMRLEAAGIDCFLFDENLVEMNPFLSNAIGGVKLYIANKDWEKARAILTEEDGPD
jgi:hypothetical protein